MTTMTSHTVPLECDFDLDPTSPRLFDDYDPQVTGYNKTTAPSAAFIGRALALDFARLAYSHRDYYHLMPPM